MKAQAPFLKAVYHCNQTTPTTHTRLLSCMGGHMSGAVCEGQGTKGTLGPRPPSD